MPNTSAAKKALRNSRKKEINNKTKKYAIKQALKELRRVLATSPKNYQTALSKVFSSLDKAVKNNIIPKGRANRKKSRVSAMVDAANGVEKPENAAELKAAKKAAPKTKKPAAKKATAKKAPAKATATKKPAAKKSTTTKKTTAKATAKKPAAKKTATKKSPAKKIDSK